MSSFEWLFRRNRTRNSLVASAALVAALFIALRTNASNPRPTEAIAASSQTSVLKVDENGLPLYVREHCILATNHTSAWMPDEMDWQRRVPAFLVIGAKKGGTTSLFQMLSQHEQIVPSVTKELLYFLPRNFPHWDDDEIGAPVHVTQARRELQTYFRTQRLARNPHLISFEATPGNVLYSTFSAQAIFCTAPWVKLVVTLRHPMDRLFSHYNFLRDPTKVGTSRQLPPFDQWVQQDVKRLQRFGVLPQDLATIEEYSGSADERRGWLAYQRADRHLGDRPLARSLYAIQLEEWYQHVREIGRDPVDTIRVIRAEDLKGHARAVLNPLAKWLGLPPMSSWSSGQKAMVTQYTSPPMKAETRAWLEKLFAPYNRRLYDLLGPEWEGIYD